MYDNYNIKVVVWLWWSEKVSREKKELKLRETVFRVHIIFVISNYLSEIGCLIIFTKNKIYL
jgi:hypothetical protein